MFDTKVLRSVFLGFALIFIVAGASAPIVASAQTAATPGKAESSIADILCSPSPQGAPAGQDLYRCINKLYRVALVIGSIGAVLMIVVAGYLYISGGHEQISTAKSMIGTSIWGIVILIASYVLLRAINPSLVEFKQISPGKVTDVGLITAAQFQSDYCKQNPQICTDTPSGGGVPTAGREPQQGVGQSQELASQILANSKIALATSHPSSGDSGSTAKLNIQDTSKGTQAKTSSDGDAKGVRVQLLDDMLRGLLGIAGKHSIRVSEIAGGDHSGTSRHYRGLAFDIDQVDGKQANASNPGVADVKALCRQLGASEVLGPGDPDHDTHIHCAW